MVIGKNIEEKWSRFSANHGRPFPFGKHPSSPISTNPGQNNWPIFGNPPHQVDTSIIILTMLDMTSSSLRYLLTNVFICLIESFKGKIPFYYMCNMFITTNMLVIIGKTRVFVDSILIRGGELTLGWAPLGSNWSIRILGKTRLVVEHRHNSNKTTAATK